jgi:hypothetical protein
MRLERAVVGGAKAFASGWANLLTGLPLMEVLG